MPVEKTWKEFRESGILWWINMILHTIGWVIVVDEDNGEIIRAYPARCAYRGFSEYLNTTGYQKVSKYLKENAEQLERESHE